MAQSTDKANLPWKVLRKIFRMTLLQLFTAAASLAGDGETIAAVFTKDGTPRGVSA
jgi:hypothetical protein